MGGGDDDAVAAIAAAASFSGQDDNVRIVALLGVGATMLVLGMLIFRRFIALSRRRYEYDLCLNALRTFMVEQLPEAGPYLLLPKLAESGERTALSMGVGLVVATFNGAVVAFGAATGVWLAFQRPWLVAAVALPLAAVTFGLHLAYGRRSAARARQSMSEVLRTRGWSRQILGVER